MKVSTVQRPFPASRFHLLRATAVATGVVALLLTGCGGDKKDKPASQTAAKVNKEEITIHQINYVLQQQRGIPASAAASASKQVLERLIDQELAVQKAQDQKIDREPRVVQQIDAARRDILARAYLEKVGNGATKPSSEEVKKYFDANPALFSQRRVYNLRELNVEARADQMAAINDKLKTAKSTEEFISYLKSSEIRFAGNQAVRAAEQLPLASLSMFAKMKDGEATLQPTPTGARIIVVAGSRAQPIDLTRATPAIELFLLNERKRKLIEDDMKALRGAAQIERLGEFAKSSATDVPAPAPAAAPEPVPEPKPIVEAPPLVVSPASAAGVGTIDAGLKGLK
jgi:EpsD family peptidyl-prolyl cis-trans isomerase